MISLLLAFLLGMAVFTDFTECTVQGYVFLDNADETVDFKRADTCSGVRDTSGGSSLVLYSPNVWVKVSIPVDKGQRIFQYHWRSALAHLGPATIPIEWGYAAKG